MTGLFLTVSLLWLVTTIGHTLDIPLQSALLIKGKPVGFTRSVHRQKRSLIVNGTVVCKEDEYKPRRSNHCCNKCLAGYVVEHDCSEEGMKSKCVACEDGFFTRAPSGSKKCSQCAQCLPQFGQVMIKRCTTINDTVCGCPAGEYKLGSDRKFTCQECSKCHNGTVHYPCTADRNTVCKCLFNFYLDATGNCRSCTECNNTDDCMFHCPPPVRRPKEEPDIIRVLIPCVITVAVLAMGIVIIIVNRKKISSILWTKKPVPEEDSSGPTQLSSPLIKSPDSSRNLHTLPGHAIYVVEESVQQQNTAQNSSLPLPDITQTTTSCLNRAEFLYKIIECIPLERWKELMRRLGVSDHIIDTSDQDNKRYKDAQYAMLSYWVCNEGSSGATMNSFFRVLKEMNLGGCAEKIEEIL